MASSLSDLIVTIRDWSNRGSDVLSIRLYRHAFVGQLIKLYVDYVLFHLKRHSNMKRVQ